MKSPLFPLLSLSEAQALEAKFLKGDVAHTRGIIHLVGEKLAQGITDCLAIYPGSKKIDSKTLHPQTLPRSILILCGKGHNTADALWAGFYFCEKNPGSQLTLLFATPLEDLKPLVKEAFDACKPFTHKVLFFESPDQWLRALKEFERDCEFDVALDGIFGLQSRKGLPDRVQAILDWVNRAPNIHLRIAVDLPTGLGEEKAFQADFTFMTGTSKAICFSEEARLSVGILRFIDVGFFKNELSDQNELCLNSQEMRELFEPRCSLTHKYHQGVVGIIGSSDLYPGAGFLSTKGALSSGVGLIYSWVPEHLIPSFTAQLPEIIWRPQAIDSLQKDLDAVHLDALVIGPGLFAIENFYHFLENKIAEIPCPIIWDASLLNEDLIPILEKRKLHGLINILTPHLGEWKRLSPADENIKVIESQSLKAFAENTGSIILLKENRLRVATGEKIYHLLGGNPILARGGTGDILAGFLGGVLAAPIGRSIQKDKSFEVILEHLLLGGLAYLSAADRWASALDSRSAHTSELVDFL